MTRETNPLLENLLFPDLSTREARLDYLLNMPCFSIIPREQKIADPWSLDMLRIR